VPGDAARKLKRTLKPWAVRAAQYVEDRSHAVVRRLTPQQNSDNPARYADHWLPADEEGARRAILNEPDVEYFERLANEHGDLLAQWIKPDDTVVDIGCGIGRVALTLASRCREIWCVDVSPKMIAFARKRLADAPNARFVVSDGTTVSQIPDGTADFVYSILVLQHLEREDAFVLLRDMHRFTRPDGLAFFTFPNLGSAQGMSAFLRNVDQGEVANVARARVYTHEEVAALLPEAGWAIEETIGLDPDILVLCRRT